MNGFELRITSHKNVEFVAFRTQENVYRVAIESAKALRSHFIIIRKLLSIFCVCSLLGINCGCSQSTNPDDAPVPVGSVPSSTVTTPNAVTQVSAGQIGSLTVGYSKIGTAVYLSGPSLPDNSASRMFTKAVALFRGGNLLSGQDLGYVADLGHDPTNSTFGLEIVLASNFFDLPLDEKKATVNRYYKQWLRSCRGAGLHVNPRYEVDSQDATIALTDIRDHKVAGGMSGNPNEPVWIGS